MRLSLILVCLTCSTIGVLGQIKFDVKVSDRHLNKVERSKNTRDKLTSYKKYYSKDSLKASRKAWREYKRENKDSLRRAGLWREAKRERGKVLTGKWYYQELAKQSKWRDAQYPPPNDSLSSALFELAGQGQFSDIQTVYKQYGHYDSAYLDQFKPGTAHLDSMTLEDRFATKKMIASYLPKELKEAGDKDIAKQMQAGMIDKNGDFKKIDNSGVKDFFQNVSPEEFAKSQTSMGALKKKYRVPPNIQKNEEGIKRKSLKGEGTGKRIVLGGNVTIQSTKPLILDADIKVGYRFNKPFSAGVGLLFREQFTDRTTSLTGDAHGYSFFANYDLTSTYFIYGEYQSVKNRSLLGESTKPVSWEHAAMLGAGRKFRISKRITGSASLMYDFNFKSNNLNARPWVFRFGYRYDF